MKRLARKLTRPALASASLAAILLAINVLWAHKPLTWDLALTALLFGVGLTAAWKLYMLLRRVIGRVTAVLAMATTAAVTAATATAVSCATNGATECTPTSIVDSGVAAAIAIAGTAVPLALAGATGRLLRRIPFRAAWRAIRRTVAVRP